MTVFAAPPTKRDRCAGVVRRATALACATLLVAVAAEALHASSNNKRDAARDARIALIRALGQEIAVCKVALPRGKRGVIVDAQGQLDQDKAQEETRSHGMAVNSGTPVQITKMEFKSDRMKLELNGGGKKGKKWYERIQIGGRGSSSTPISTQTSTMAYGSSITLMFPGKVETVTPEQAKKLLAGVLDFERHSPTVLYSPHVPPEIKEAIKNHQVIVGMDRDAVLSSKGPPDRKIRESRDGVEQEDWIYGLPPKVLFRHIRRRPRRQRPPVLICPLTNHSIHISFLNPAWEPSDVRHHLYSCGYERDEDALEVETQWVRNKTSPFSSLLMPR